MPPDHMTGHMTKRDAIRRIARDTGYSESSIYKILKNPFNFSKNAVDTVQASAVRHGLTGEFLSEEPDPSQHDPVISRHDPVTHMGGKRVLQIGVLIPSRPLYFWREAVMGMEKSRERVEKEYDITIRLRYTYYSYPFNETEGERLFANLASEHLDALILYPVDGDACRRFLETGTRDTAVILFNDTQTYMTDVWFAAHPNIGSIAPDCYDEGRRAARIIAEEGPAVRHVAVICARHNHGVQTSDQRALGVCDALSERCPEVRISRIVMDIAERMVPSMLARRLMPCYSECPVDALYITTGLTHIACAAVEKIERRLGVSLSTFVIGHEFSPADKRYLLEGRQRGYIKQDVYTQGHVAIRDAVAAALGIKSPPRCLYQSSVFMR